MTPADYEALREFATSRQCELLDALSLHGSHRKAAKAVGMSARNFTDSLRRLRTRSASQGLSPMHGLTVPYADGFSMSLATIHRRFVDGAGEIVNVWERMRKDAPASIDFMDASIEAFKSELPKIRPAAHPRKYDTDIIPWFQIGDAHIGMLSHEEETGQNFDLKIAKRELCKAMSILIDEARPSERCVINDMGDGTHYENYRHETEASGHVLDADGRFPKMVDVYIDTMRFIIERAMTKFKHVDVIINQGNHSRTNDIWAAKLFRAAYEHTGRVNVVDNTSVFIPYRMGKTFVLCHHTDKCKPAQLAKVMATDYPEEWGETMFRYIDGGHVHHQMVTKEHPGVVYESWNNLAAADKYAHDGGWRSRQLITRVDRSKTYGDIGRRVLSIHEVRDAIRAAHGPQEHESPTRRKVYTV